MGGTGRSTDHLTAKAFWPQPNQRMLSPMRDEFGPPPAADGAAVWWSIIEATLRVFSETARTDQA
jgi:hypothetical protein